MTQYPCVDDQSVTIDAPAAAVWRALGGRRRP